MSGIPQAHQDFCKAVARLCRERGIERASFTYRPNYSDAWQSEITMSWGQGRHGEDSDRIILSSTVLVRTDIKGSQP